MTRTSATQDLRPQHRRERNPERPLSNPHGDGPFLRPAERVPEVPVVSREHLPQLEIIQEVLPSRRDEAHFRLGVSKLITPNLWNFQTVLHTLAATQEVPRHTRLHSRGSTRVPPTSRGAPFPPPSSRGGILSLRARERIPGIPIASQGEVSPQERREELQGRATIPRVPQMPQSNRLTTRWHVGHPCWKASWESLVGKPRGKATDPLIHAKGSATLLLQPGRKAHMHAPTRDDD